MRDEFEKFRKAYPESVSKREKFNKGDFIGQKYEVVDILGEGGCGIVYLVYVNPDHPFYALKTFKGDYFEKIAVRERFRKEAQVWIDLGKHPYLVRAYWVDQISERLFIAMEWVAPEEEGAPNSLDAYLKHSPPDLTQSLHWAIQFCYGIEYAYSKGVKAHRDIKPANIMIDHNKTVKISDFGLAGLLTSQEIEHKKTAANFYQTMAGTSMGTPTHMPPEQFINAASCDERSDIYSFGIVLYQMASGGKLPFYADNPDYFLSVLKHLHHEAPVPKLDSPLFPLIQKCLEKEPRKRYLSFKDLRIDLQVILKGLTGEVVELPQKEDMSSWEWNNRGVSLDKLSKFREAISCFEKAINIDPLNSGAWNNKGNSLSCLGRRSEALSCYEKALKINPSNARAWTNRGALLSDLGQLDDALQCLTMALDIKPVDSRLISQIVGIISTNKFKSAEIKAICQKIVKLNLIPNNVDGLYNLGLCYLQIEDIDNALIIFLKGENLDGSDCGIWFELMNIYYKKQDEENTLKYCDKLIGAHKYFDAAVKKKSLVLFHTGKKQEAVRLLKDVLADNDTFDMLWLTLSDIHEQSYDFSEALDAANKCLQILNKSKSEDNDRIAYVNKVIDGLTEKLKRESSPEIEQAIRKLRVAEIEHYKQKPHADAIKQLTQFYLNEGNKQKALYYCDMLIKTTNYITDFGNKALVMSHFGDYAGAVRLLTEILKEWPHVDSLWYVLSNVHEQHGNYSEALKAAIKCKEILLRSKNPKRQNLMDVESKIQELQKLLTR